MAYEDLPKAGSFTGNFAIFISAGKSGNHNIAETFSKIKWKTKYNGLRLS